MTVRRMDSGASAVGIEALVMVGMLTARQTGG